MPSVDEYSNSTTITSTTNGGEAEMGYKRCECCPFGFHIDRDFVPFSKKMLSREGNMQKLQELKEKWRSQRQSMDKLLGIPTEPVGLSFASIFHCFYAKHLRGQIAK